MSFGFTVKTKKLKINFVHRCIKMSALPYKKPGTRTDGRAVDNNLFGNDKIYSLTI